jgi:23S rRNA (cytosine1962-C5)-methyltransferase
MKFLWLKDSQVSVLFENDEIVAVDKPYGFDTHTNDAKAGQVEFIQPGLIELYEKQRGHAFHIVHRLDRTTTGVIVFAKSEEAAKIYQGFFRARETKKTYQFVTNAQSKSGQAESRQPIIRNGVELEAATDFKLVKRLEGFELWEAHPRTGRNHQVRIHAAAVGLPLLGDEKYSGAKFPFICLHNRRIEFPNGVVIESKSPRYFDDLSLLNDLTIARALLDIEKRERIYQFAVNGGSRSCSSLSLRLIHTQKESSDRGLSLDRFGERLVLSWYQDRWTIKDQTRYSALSEILKIPILVRHMKEKREPETLGGVHLEKWLAQENEQKHELRTQGLGLFLDQRLQRQWVKDHSAGKSVLNLFAYTCGFSVAAAMGGAKDVTSVDLNKNMLNWGRENFQINELMVIDASRQSFLCRDAVQFLEQAKVKRQMFDLIVCDPPNFARQDKHLFKIESELEGLIRHSLEILNPRGQLLISTNSDTLFVDDIRKMIEGLARALKIKTLDIASVQPSFDFEAPGEKPGLKSFLISKI